MSKHEQIMVSLLEKHKIVTDLIGKCSADYVDIPVHGNIGDLLIMDGTLRFIERYSIKIKRIAAHNNYDWRWLEKGQVLLLHGGGNLGDIYLVNQKRREEWISNLHGNRVIILPQTIFFADEKNYKACCDIFSAHPDLHICVRDKVSFSLAEKMSKNVYLLPDMAHQLWPIKKLEIKNKYAELVISRTDSERKFTVQDALATYDWPDLVGSNRYIVRAFQIAFRLFHLMKIDRRIVRFEARLWAVFSRYLISRAINLFSKYDRIETDRLHGHILATLMEVDNTLVDNAYGKNSTYYNEWTFSLGRLRAK